MPWPMRLDEWLRQAEQHLTAKGIESARLEAQMLGAHALRVDRTWLLAHPDHDFSELAGEHLLQRRLAHEPLSYITGWREFYGRRFSVRPGVLIPRHETEVLVDAALEIGGSSAALKVLDIGTGSGCLAATLKLERPSWTVLAGDFSMEALHIASENCDQLGANVQLVRCDAFSGFARTAFNLIVTNPPYVAVDDDLPDEIKSWEPHLALFAEEDGYAFYRRLSQEAHAVLKPGGTMVLELGQGQLQRVREIFESKGWEFAKSWRDLSGLERVLGVTHPH